MIYLEQTDVLDAAYPIPITTGGTNWWRRIHQQAIPALPEGAILQISGVARIVNPTRYNVQIITALTMGAACNWVDEGPSWGSIIKPAGGMNISPDNHYADLDLAWQKRIGPGGFPAATLEWRAKAHADNADGQCCTILQGYSGMQVTIHGCGP